MRSYEEQLEEVDKAISDILTGAQEASFNGKKVVKADLDSLLKYQIYLKSEIKKQKRSGIRVRLATPM